MQISDKAGTVAPIIKNRLVMAFQLYRDSSPYLCFAPTQVKGVVFRNVVNGNNICATKVLRNNTKKIVYNYFSNRYLLLVEVAIWVFCAVLSSYHVKIEPTKLLLV